MKRKKIVKQHYPMFVFESVKIVKINNQCSSFTLDENIWHHVFTIP